MMVLQQRLVLLLHTHTNFPSPKKGLSFSQALSSCIINRPFFFDFLHTPSLKGGIAAVVILLSHLFVLASNSFEETSFL